MSLCEVCLELAFQWKSGTALLRCMVWKDDLLAFGDTAGRIGVWDLARKMCRQTGMSPSSRGPALKCVFSRLAGDATLAVQHPTSVAVWDTETLQQLHQFHHPGLNVVDIDMCGLSPIYVASDGIFRYALDGNRNSPLPERGRIATIELRNTESPVQIFRSSSATDLHECWKDAASKGSFARTS